MCNLYRMTSATAEIARLFGGTVDAGANVGTEVYPGYPGLVMAEGRVRSMVWGFPLALKGKAGQLLKPKAVNNARTDNDNCIDARDRFYCRTCWMAAKGKARPIRIESVKQLIVIELPLPDERVWKREQRRFRG